MKNKISISIIFIFISVSLFSQIKKGDSEMSLSTNVFYSSKSIDETQIKSTMESFSIGTGINAQHYFKDFLSFEIGLNYSWSFNNAFNRIYSDSLTQESISSNEIKTLIPSLKLVYNHELFKRFYIKGSLGANYGIASFYEKSNYTNMKLTLPGIYQIDNYTEITTEEFERFGKFNYISIDIKPKIQYYFNNKIGMTLGLGGMEYFANNNSFLFTFGPAYWTLSLDVKF